LNHAYLRRKGFHPLPLARQYTSRVSWATHRYAENSRGLSTDVER